MKCQIGDAIIGCMKSTLKNIGTGVNHILFLTSVGSRGMKYNSVKNSLMLWLEDINLNLINLFQKKINKYIIYSSKKKKVPVQRPMDAIRLMVEDQCLQISDLTEIIKKQGEEIRTLKARLNAKDSLEKEKKQKEEAEASSWFWAARTSD